MGAILRAENVRRRRNRIAIAAVTLMGLIALALPRLEAFATGASGDPTPFGGAVTNNYQVWEPLTSSWVPGNAMGYSEGEVAAFSIELTSGDLPASPDGNFYTLTACFTHEHLSTDTIAFDQSGPWGFTTSYGAATRNGGIVSTANGVSTDWGTVFGASLVSCGSSGGVSYFGYQIVWEKPDPASGTAPDQFYLYFGTRLSKGGVNGVPFGKSVGFWPLGTFQSYLVNVTGNKTVNFKPEDVDLPPGNIVIDKVTDPSGSAQVFDFSTSWAGTVNATDGSNYVSPPLDSTAESNTTYSVEEINVPSGWTLDSSVCVDGNGATVPDNTDIELDPAETIVCTFTNSLTPGTIIVEKQTDPDGSPQSFDFTTSYGGGSFSLTDGQQNDSGNLLPSDEGFVGTYSVAEASLPSGWTNSSTVCTSSAGGTEAADAIDLDPGETVTCVFTNTLARGEIIVEKQTDPDGATQSFEFDPSWSGTNFFLADGQTENSGALLPSDEGFVGTYSVAEVNLPSGWSLSSATCDDGSDPAAIDLDPGEVVTCTFDNTLERGNIVVVKQTDPDGSTQPFDFSTDYGTFSLKDDEHNDSGSLLPSDEGGAGTYAVAEINIPTGWTNTSTLCVSSLGGTEAAGAIDLDPGETVTCTFNNTIARGNIIVEKQTDPDGSTQSFEFDPSWSATNFFLTDGTTNDSGALLPTSEAGTYSVAEVNLPTGWSLTSATCDDGSDPSAIDLGPGETVTCTFSNRIARGNIVVIKQTDPDGSRQPFEFDPSWGANFFLADNQQSSVGNLLPTSEAGTYSVTEVNLPAGWTASSVVCDDGSLSSAIDLAPGETVTCVFNNTQQGTITVKKVTVDASGDTQAFAFDPDYQGPNITLGNGGSDTSAFLNPGTYSVAEVNIPAGWDLTDLTCVDLSGGTTTNLAAGSASIDLAAGENVTCTFTNTKRGSITIVKEDVSAFDNPGDGDDFTFAGDFGAFSLDDPDLDDADGVNGSVTFGNLLAGDYTVTETLPADANPLDLYGPWSLADVVCVGGDAADITDGVTISLDPGEAITCTFQNVQTEIVLEPLVIGDFVWEDLDDDGIQDAGEPGLAGVIVRLVDGDGVVATAVTSASGQYLIQVTEPGTYSVQFVAPLGYDFVIPFAGDAAVDSNALGVTGTGQTPSFELTVADFLLGNDDLTIDAGLVEPEIPETGFDTDRLGLLAAGLVAGGFVMILLGRRRRDEQ